MPSFSADSYWHSSGWVAPSGPPPRFPSCRPDFPSPVAAAFAALPSGGKAVVVYNGYDKQDQYDDGCRNDDSDNDFFHIDIDHVYFFW